MSDDQEIADVLESIRASTREIQAFTRETNEKRAADREAFKDVNDGIEKERRSGKHGRDWQLVQERIDQKRTTLDDVVNGVDLTPEAHAVRTQMGGVLAEVRDQLKDAVESDDGENDYQKVQRAQAELSRTLEQMRTLNFGL